MPHQPPQEELLTAPQAFDAIARDDATFLTFATCIGDLNAPSRVLAAARAVHHRTVLDLGCGPAVWWRSLVSASTASGCPAPIYTGADASPAMLARARVAAPELDRPERLVAIEEGKWLPWPDRHFDFVFVRHLLEHLIEAKMISQLREALRVTKSELVIAFSQCTQGVRPAPILTDEHLGAKRWAHRVDAVTDAVEASGFLVLTRTTTPVPREEVWICERAR